MYCFCFKIVIWKYKLDDNLKGSEHHSWTFKDKFLVEMRLLMQFVIFFLFEHFKQINFISCRIKTISVVLSKFVFVCYVNFFTLEKICNYFFLEKRVGWNSDTLKLITINQGITDPQFTFNKIFRCCFLLLLGSPSSKTTSLTAANKWIKIS